MITILCSGSRGDFQPYIALAMELKKLGKDVRITGSRSFESFVRSYGIDFYPVQADMDSLKVDPKLLQEAASADNPFKMLLTFHKMKKYGVFMAKEFYESCVGSDLIIYHPGVTMGYFAAEKLGIPSVVASPFPLHKTKHQTSVIRYGRSKSTPFNNILSYKMLQGMLWLASKDGVKSFWKQHFGKTPDNFGVPYERHNDSRHPAVISCSNYVFERPDDWNENVHQNGYWFVEEQMEYTPSKELVNFLSAGEKPVYIGFGSVTPKDQKDSVCGLIIQALTKSGKRGIISGLGSFDNLPETVMTVDNIPHSWLFERVSAVCHHGGAGTTAAGFKAGVPSIIVPFSNDQFAWAHRSYDLGVGAEPVYYKELTANKLADAIQYALKPEIAAKAKKLGENIATENGAKECAIAIVNCLER